MSIADKKVLIISHNPLSCVNNNGKTLASIFEDVPKGNIYQIYLNSDIPDYSEECNYLQINEKQIIGSFLKMKNLCCREVAATPGTASSATIKRHSFANHTKRLLRECVWKIGIWKKKLCDWLRGKHFDVVFFMAGDGLFAYDVYRFVMKHTDAKGCVFFTDDYIIGKTSRSPAYLLRRRLLKRKMKKALKITKELYVISEEMRSAYREIFDLDGYVVRNFSVERKNAPSESVENDSRGLVMVYAGGLHYNRWKVLSDVANALSEINAAGERKCFLRVYSSQKIEPDIIEKLTVDGASAFMGSASAEQIADVYSSADVLLHVESFEKKAIASTKYSFSTKIPEYLSANKCVLAVGPNEVASIGYLSQFACVVNDCACLSAALTELINNNEYRHSIKNECQKYYDKDFSKRTQEDCLRHIFSV